MKPRVKSFTIWQFWLEQTLLGGKRVLKGNRVEQIRFGKDELFPLTAFRVDLIICLWPLHVTDDEGSQCCVFLLRFTGVKVICYQFMRGNTFFTLPFSVITIQLHYVCESREIRRQGLTPAQNKVFFFCKLIFWSYVNPQLSIKMGYQNKCLFRIVGSCGAISAVWFLHS